MTPANVLRGPPPYNAATRSGAAVSRAGRRWWGAVALALGSVSGVPVRALLAQAGTVQGQVRDSASGEVVPGAVVLLLDARGEVVARTLTGTRGQFTLTRPLAAVQVRALRLGFTPVALTLPAGPDELSPVVLTLAPVTRLLPSVGTVVARGCPRPPNGEEAFGLLDQARAGLLATVIAREKLPALMRVVQYQRHIGVDGVTIEQQTVRVDSAVRTATSFSTQRSAHDLVDRGFRTGVRGEFTYTAPDADVLLSDAFQRGYCFRLAEADSARPTQRGLRFTPARRRSSTVDIEGIIWIDTAQRVLREVEFAFVGVDELMASLGAGGRMGFHTLPNGLVFIAQWSMRLVGARDPLTSPLSAQDYSIREIGGEVAEVQVGDSGAFYAPLGSAHITAVTTTGAPVAAARIRLANTDYQAITNSAGRATIPFVLPGSYQVMVDDVALEPAGLSIPLASRLVVPRAASTIVRLVVPTAEQFVAPLCGQETFVRGDAWLVAKITDAKGEPLAGASYTVSSRSQGDALFVAASGTVPSTGMIAVCRLSRGGEVEIAAWKSRSQVARQRERLDGQITAVRMTMASRQVSQGPDSDPVPFVAAGTVRDSATGTVVANARIAFPGTPFEAASDESGRFVMSGLKRGEHRVEVSTPWLDSIGAVRRTTVTLDDNTPVTLFLPSVDETLRSSCGVVVREGDGAIVGQVNSQVTGPLPAALRVIAEWDSVGGPVLRSPPAGDSQWGVRSRAVAPVGAQGSYRLCGVPTGQIVAVRVSLETTASPEGVDVRVDPIRRFARVDLTFQVP